MGGDVGTNGDTAHGPAEPLRRPRPGPGPTRRAPAQPERRRPDISRYLDEPAVPPTQSDDAAPPPAPETPASGDSSPGVLRRVAGDSKRIVRFAVRLVAVLAVTALVAVLLRIFVVSPYEVDTRAMEPALRGCPSCPGDRVLVDRMVYRLHPPHTGDVVVFDRPAGVRIADAHLVRRVVAEGGDRVRLSRGRVLVNGRLLAEAYLDRDCGRNPTRAESRLTSWRVPDDDVFVLGDDRCRSIDSRRFGPVPASSMTGRVAGFGWPLGRIGLL